MSDAVLPGKVEWTGDNPFIYLKTQPDGDWSSLSVFFRITASDHGSGHFSLVVTHPYDSADASAVGLTDNEPLARYLLSDFVSKFVLFRPTKALETLTLHTGAVFTQDITEDVWTEAACDTAAHAEVVFRWHRLGEPFAVHVPAPQSGTGKHDMLSVFRTAQSADVTLNGTSLPGATIERPFLNGPSQSAALALSETWVQA